MVKENRPHFVEMINGVGDYPLSCVSSYFWQSILFLKI